MPTRSRRPLRLPPSAAPADLTKITVPTLVIHGDSDAIVPFEVSGHRTHAFIAGSELALIKDAPHGVTVSRKEEWNRRVLAFLAK
ncbi:alpha/beta fold hydrolase [Cryobacterium sp. Y57]|uniref:alpha/beta fold hydrolase n=1 Tax=Cryobacterium sp. Y57 TaxID=2048287 RepID=UPI001E2EF206|nr:alpha/beta hydrolase [Cryobacterium sp. Y57]